MITLSLVFVLTILLGVPVAFCLGLAGVAFILLSPQLPFNIMPTLMFGGIDSFPLMAIPFFIMAGDLMGRCGVLPKLVDLADSLVGHLKGGLAYVNILASMFFAGVTGVAVADTAAIGSMLVPSMIKQGYSRSFSAVVTAASSIMGPIIPPSVAMLIYAYVYGGGISVAKLFLLGAVPGCIIGFGMMGLVYVMSSRHNFPVSSMRFSIKNVAKRMLAAIPGLMVPVIILGGIIGGIFTPTEAGAVAVAYALIVGLFFTRQIGLKDIAKCFLSSCRTTAVVFMLLATAKIIAWILTTYQVPQTVAQSFLQLTANPQIFMLLSVLFLLMLGFVLEAVATMIMLIPVFGPVSQAYGIEPHHFGLLVVMTVQIALITPPVALGLFIICPIAECSLEDTTREIWPFLFLVFAVILLVAFWPGVTTWVPKLFGLK
jgi:tripartite ATP-independent transporter DctM subunit